MASSPAARNVDGPAPAPGSRVRAWWPIVPPLMAMALISHVNRVSIATAGDTVIMARYGLSPTRMGVVYSAFLLAYTAAMVPGGLFIDRVKPRAALAAVGFGSAVFVALTGVVGLTARGATAAFAALLVVRGLMGVVSSPLHPACAAAVDLRVPPGGRSLVNGLVTGAALVGIAATPPAFGALIGWFDWPAAFLVTAVVTVGVALFWSLAAADPPPGTTGAPARAVGGTGPGPSPAGSPSWWGLLADRSLILLTLSYAAVGYFQYLFFYWMNFYFKTQLGLPDATSRAYAAVPPLAMAVGMPLGGWLSDRLERASGARRARKIVPMAGMSAGAVLLALGVVAREPAWIAAWFALALGAVGTAEGPFWATATALGGRRRGSSAALFNTGGNAGGMLAPVVTPWVGEHYGWGPAVALGGLVCLAGVALWLGIDPGGDAREP